MQVSKTPSTSNILLQQRCDKQQEDLFHPGICYAMHSWGTWHMRIPLDVTNHRLFPHSINVEWRMCHLIVKNLKQIHPPLLQSLLRAVGILLIDSEKQKHLAFFRNVREVPSSWWWTEEGLIWEEPWRMEAFWGTNITGNFAPAGQGVKSHIHSRQQPNLWVLTQYLLDSCSACDK